MRLHRLEITAFGPFAQTTSVDFDALSAGGLFLLSGATGAGKTSVLDAVCFALYGAVPGERNDAKRLRSDQADASTPPRVSLEATLSGRRFRIVRSPAWQRPKKRGPGVTAQQAAVVVSELVEGTWLPLTTRLDESGHLISGLVGMNLTQFTQVAMLPQGRFQAFLRASSDDRHRLLQQLFRTERFERVESWLRDRRLVLQRHSHDHERSVTGLVHRISETAQASAPAADESAQQWSATLVAAANDLAASLGAALPGLRDAEATTRAALEAGKASADRRTRLAEAIRERERLLQKAPEVARSRAVLAAAARARGVVPLQRVVIVAGAAAEDAELRVVRERARAAALLGLEPEELTAETVPELVRDAADASARARALLPRERERAELADQLALARNQRGEADLSEVRARAASAREAATRLPAEQSARDVAVSRVEAGRTLQAVRNELVVAQLDLNQVVTARLVLAEELVMLQQARLDGMAAEIAGRLAAGGGSCPVCGSQHHPHLATAAPGAPDAAAEKALRKRLDDAEFEQHTRASHAKDLETRAALALQAAGTDDLDALTRALADAEAVLRDTAHLAAGAEELERLAATVAELDATIAPLAARLAEVTSELASALGDDHGDVSSLIAHRAAVADATASLQESHAALVVAERHRDDAVEALAATAAEAGFPDVPSALAAALPHDEVVALQAAVDEHARRMAAVEAVLADPALSDAREGESPDLETLASAHLAAADELASALAAEQQEVVRATRLVQLDRRLSDAVTAWDPVRAELDLVSSVASFAEGKSGDNQLQMRLSAYVLAFRLTQVVDAANVRLATMSDRRYSLEHTGRRGAGERRGGLSLLVRDDWSGESRDPATLSGGETFVVSLALALGLADVIMHEVGGVGLDTLFVDEGFGSLDADTLDDVMETLDSLRDGGRVVGVVSHVAEMRDRIPTQLVVSKARTGSTVHLRG
ncbi:SMC family ATPase [Nocardioides agariphilus]|uniref:Nuclease SbcCD subunit C n=1 Tax=Nocardioides agariphilus TaxID=433664 RepID=A0A930VNT2_9ACTN|nr:SMC family ATPase [Nocardioides agariphilus]MBF4767230.1 SMC family ATPase [Nocardioides agariphilus]